MIQSSIIKVVPQHQQKINSTSETVCKAQVSAGTFLLPATKKGKIYDSMMCLCYYVLLYGNIMPGCGWAKLCLVSQPIIRNPSLGTKSAECFLDLQGAEEYILGEFVRLQVALYGLFHHAYFLGFSE